MLNMFLAVNWNSKDAIKFEKKAIRKNRNLQKTSPKQANFNLNKLKTSKFQFKKAQKTSNPQVSKKTHNFTKKQAQIHGKTTTLATLNP